jgi:citrate lyase subunit beta/citryl-CoA lyase
MLQAPSYGADALIFDLEDAVPLSKKDEARKLVGQALTELAETRTYIFVRVNPWRSGHLLDDILAVVGRGLKGIVLPKVDGPADVTALDHVLSSAERRAGTAPGTTEIVPLTETASAVEHAYAIYCASPRIYRTAGIAGLTPGSAGDLHRALGVLPTSEGQELLYASSRCVVASQAAGARHVLGGMTVDLSDQELLIASLTRAKQLGADGSMAIHPSQIGPIHRVFTPTTSEIEEAVGILRAMIEAAAKGEAAVRYRDRLVDVAHAASALRLLKRASEIGLEAGGWPTTEELGAAGLLDTHVEGPRPRHETLAVSRF